MMFQGTLNAPWEITTVPKGAGHGSRLLIGDESDGVFGFITLWQ